ncbi:MAG: twin-arginine translocase TatA/TatE family subunit [Phycisphaerales bacterium]|nr:twin-arginine translocase TatA/TatE family subunit [Phycisphaerales bacterium]
MVHLIHALPPALFGNFLEGPDLLIVGIIALVIFGPRLPSIARSMGRTIVEFKKGLKETADEVSNSTEDEKKDKASLPAPPAATPTRQIKQISSVTDEP